MGTSAGFFGITYQGATNGLASVTLSIFNCDHPDDVAWCKHVFDYSTNNSGFLTKAKVPDFLRLFYRNRPQGNTLSGTYLYSYPENDKEFIDALFGMDGKLTFATLIEALKEAQGRFAEPAAPLEYGSAAVLRNDKTKHTRCVLNPQQRFRKPIATSQEVGWELYKEVKPELVASFNDTGGPGTPFRLRTSATTQFADAIEKITWGRSIGGEFSAYATRKLVAFGGQGMGV